MAIATTTALALGVMAVSTAATLYAQDTQSKQAEVNQKFAADQAQADANAERGAAMVEAERIRKAAKAQRAQAVAAAAASGVDVNSPTALRIDQDITKNAEEDALLTILNGKDRGARLGQQAQVYRTGASLARTEGRLQQGATLLSAAGAMTNYGQGWKKAG